MIDVSLALTNGKYRPGFGRNPSTLKILKKN